MKFFRLDLLTLLISLFILNSCKREDGIGLGVNPLNQINGSLIVDSNIVINTIPEDTAVTSGLAKTPLANFVDPDFGTTISNLVLDLSLPDESQYIVPTGTLSIDSAVMVLHYKDGFYGDSLASRYRVNVYQLAEQILPQTYYNNKHWKANMGVLLGTRLFTAHTHDSVTIDSIRVGKVDTIQKVAPQLRIPFSKTFIYNNLFNASGTQLSSNAIFQSIVKGLYVTLDRDQQSSAGGIIQFALDSSSVDVFYKAVNGSTIDTAMVTMPFSSFAADITHVYTATITAALNQTGSANTIYLQGLAGLKAKVSFPDLAKFAGDSIILNRAELVIAPKAGSGIPYLPLPKLTMYQLDIAHQRVALQDATGDPRSMLPDFGGLYSRTAVVPGYHFLITAYIQDLIRKKTIDYGTYIAPVDTTLVNTAAGIDTDPTVQVGARSILAGSDKSQYSIKLNIIYTKVRK